MDIGHTIGMRIMVPVPCIHYLFSVFNSSDWIDWWQRQQQQRKARSNNSKQVIDRRDNQSDAGLTEVSDAHWDNRILRVFWRFGDEPNLSEEP